MGIDDVAAATINDLVAIIADLVEVPEGDVAVSVLERSDLDAAAQRTLRRVLQAATDVVAQYNIDVTGFDSDAVQEVVDAMSTIGDVYLEIASRPDANTVFPGLTGTSLEEAPKLVSPVDSELKSEESLSLVIIIIVVVVALVSGIVATCVLFIKKGPSFFKNSCKYFCCFGWCGKCKKKKGRRKTNSNFDETNPLRRSSHVARRSMEMTRRKQEFEWRQEQVKKEREKSVHSRKESVVNLNPPKNHRPSHVI
jgi:flagellar basal body-associated protein FliL